MSFIFQVTSESDAKTAFTVALEKYKGLDVLVNCAGIGVAIATFAPGKKTVHPQAAFEQVLQVRLALFCLCHYRRAREQRARAVRARSSLV